MGGILVHESSNLGDAIASKVFNVPFGKTRVIYDSNTVTEPIWEWVRTNHPSCLPRNRTVSLTVKGKALQLGEGSSRHPELITCSADAIPGWWEFVLVNGECDVDSIWYNIINMIMVAPLSLSIQEIRVTRVSGDFNKYRFQVFTRDCTNLAQMLTSEDVLRRMGIACSMNFYSRNLLQITNIATSVFTEEKNCFVVFANDTDKQGKKTERILKLHRLVESSPCLSDIRYLVLSPVRRRKNCRIDFLEFSLNSESEDDSEIEVRAMSVLYETLSQVNDNGIENIDDFFGVQYLEMLGDDR